MTEIKKLLPNMDRVLVPIDRSDASERAVRFAACLLAPLSQDVVKEIVLLHVLGVGFLEKMAINIDLRIAALKETPLFKRLAREYIEKEVMPFMEEAEGLLREAGVKCPVRKEVIEGDPTKEIINFALKEEIHTIIMGRRRRSALAERVLGSCSYAVTHRPGRHTDYIVGLEEIDIHACPVPKILVPVDGSSFAHNALTEAAALALAFPKGTVEISVLYVVETAYEENDGEGQKTLKEAREYLVSLGLPEDKVESILAYGDPAEEIARIAEEGHYNIIMMGRTGKSGLRELILGSVSSRVLHLVERPTVALISPAD
ncbi:MAG: universal stress protein [Thermodesulfobacteria bacterium]|nr:universal stress protein [Thermodesulfobacteriota bacterium]